MNGLYVLDTDCFTLFQFGHEWVVTHAAAVDRLAITIVTVDWLLSTMVRFGLQSCSKTQAALRSCTALAFSATLAQAKYKHLSSRSSA